MSTAVIVVAIICGTILASLVLLLLGALAFKKRTDKRLDDIAKDFEKNFRLDLDKYDDREV